MPTISEAELRDRARGILLGMAGAESASGSLRLTWLAMELGESLIERGSVEAEGLLRRWSGIDPSECPRPGSITGQALRLFSQGFPAEGLAEATARLVPGRSGDGPLARALPLAVAARQEGALLKRWADQSARVTHSDLTSRMATIGSCLLARDLLTRGLEESLARVAQALREEAPLRLSRVLLNPSRSNWPEAGDDAVAVLSQAIHALARASDLAGTLAELENQGHPGHGAWALAGGLAGAAFGADPGSGGVAQMEQGLRVRLEGLADRLVEFEAEGHGARSAGAARVPLPGPS